MALNLQAAGKALKSLTEGLKGQKVAVLGHMRPDGDCIGSQVALARLLQATGTDAICINRDRIPPNLLPYAEGVTFLKADQYQPDGRVAVTVDCADASRVGTEVLSKFPAGVFANIDHHASNPEFAKVNIVVKEAAATCHILAAAALQENLPIDSLTAENLHLGILTDTGRFCYESATAEVLEVVAQLLRKGARPAEALHRVFEQESPGKLALVQRFLATLRYYEDGKICTGEITQADYQATQTTKEDKEGLVEFPRSLAGVELAVLFEEGIDGIRGSLRARDKRLRLDLLAGKLNGGGHILAAGFNMIGCRLTKDRERLMAIIVQHYREHLNG